MGWSERSLEITSRCLLRSYSPRLTNWDGLCVFGDRDGGNGGRGGKTNVWLFCGNHVGPMRSLSHWLSSWPGCPFLFKGSSISIWVVCGTEARLSNCSSWLRMSICFDSKYDLYWVTHAGQLGGSSEGSNVHEMWRCISQEHC